MNRYMQKLSQIIKDEVVDWFSLGLSCSLFEVELMDWWIKESGICYSYGVHWSRGMFSIIFLGVRNIELIKYY